MSDNKLLNIYLDFTGGLFRRDRNGLYIIELPEDTFFYNTYAEMIRDIKYTILQWELENIEF